MKLVSAKAPGCIHVGLSNQEAIDQIRHLYPRLGPALNNIIDRFQELVDYTAVTQVVEVGENAPTPSCPHCGTPLKLTP